MRLVHLVLLFFFFIILLFIFFFFFSSRRRHTRSLRDWSSDVCSSDLTEADLTNDPFIRPRGAEGATFQNIAPIGLINMKDLAVGCHGQPKQSQSRSK